MKTVERELNCETLRSFSFQTDERSADFVVDWFCEWLENYITGGAEIQDGQTLQIGYTLLQCNVDSKTLTLESPTFESMPIEWCPNLGPTFQILGWHKYIPESFSFVSDIPTLSQTAIVGQQFSGYPMFGNRLESTSPNDSGWFFGSMLDSVDNNDPDQLTLMSLYEAMLTIPHMIPYLSMPQDCQIMFSTKTPELLQNYEPLKIEPGSMIQMLLDGQ